MSYAQLVVNLIGRVRRVTWNGRRYLVAPLTSIVPGVLPGSQGPLLYPPHEIARNHRDWDGIPITKYHPFNPLTGEHLSAQSPGVIDRQGIGTIRNSVYRGKLCHEGWFDEEHTQHKAPEVHNALLNGQQMEISTGLFTENEPAPVGSTFSGRPYSHIARNYKPDHMAILPDQVGACSIQDGCGLNVNATSGQSIGPITPIQSPVSPIQPVQPTVGKTGKVKQPKKTPAVAIDSAEAATRQQQTAYNNVLTPEEYHQHILNTGDPQCPT